MLETSLQKIDKYYLALLLVLILMATLIVFSFRGIFSAFLTASSFDPSEVGGQLRVDREKLDEAYSWAFSKQTVTLEP